MITMMISVILADVIELYSRSQCDYLRYALG